MRLSRTIKHLLWSPYHPDIMSRLFFALWPDDVTRKQLFSISKQLDEPSIRLVKEANLHMTLAFLGDVSEFETKHLLERAATINNPSFELQLTHVCWWKKPQILFIGTETIPDALLQLVNTIRDMVQQQGLTIDTRPYRPHVTIARKAKQPIETCEPFIVAWRADSFALVISESGKDGVNYRVLQSWHLTKHDQA